MAEETPNGARIVKPVSDALIATLKERQIDVLILDPFVSSHAVPHDPAGGVRNNVNCRCRGDQDIDWAFGLFG